MSSVLTSVGELGSADEVHTGDRRCGQWARQRRHSQQHRCITERLRSSCDVHQDWYAPNLLLSGLLQLANLSNSQCQAPCRRQVCIALIVKSQISHDAHILHQLCPSVSAQVAASYTVQMLKCQWQETPLHEVGRLRQGQLCASGDCQVQLEPSGETLN